MILYLVRHGKTDAHLEHNRQSPSISLGKYGKDQVEALADRFGYRKIDCLYSSDWPRAIETARIISETLKLDVETYSLLHEIDVTQKLDGISQSDELNIRYIKESWKNRYDLDWRFESGGESMRETIERARKVIEFLEKKHPMDRVMMVSHGMFMAVMVTLFLLGPDFDEKIFVRINGSLEIQNASVSSFDYDPETRLWKMTRFNEFS